MQEITVELKIDGQWQNISDDVRGIGGDGVTITHGQQDEANSADYATCKFEIQNGPSKHSTPLGIVGRYGTVATQNPESDLYGKLHRNHPVRARVPATSREGLWLPGVTSSDASTPDAASLDITGDIDVRVDLTKTWHPEFNETLLQKYDFSGDQRSWRLRLISTGGLQFEWSTDGTSSGAILGAVSDVLPDDGARRAVRATLDVDDGAGNRVLRYYTASTIDGPWTQLGSASTVAGTTSIFSSSASLEIGVFEGTAHAAEVRNGIDGTVVTSPDFATGDPDDRTITDGQNLVWTINGQARIVRPDIRFCGGVPSWSPKWAQGGVDLWVPIQAAGVLRRMAQGASALRSSLYRDLSTKTNLAAYWPCEDGESAARVAPGVGTEELAVVGSVSLAAASGIDGTDPLPEFTTGTLVGRVPNYSEPTDQRIMALLRAPEGGVSGTSRSVLQLQSTGTIREWRLRVHSTGELQLHGWNSEHVEVVTSSLYDADLNGEVAIVWLWLQALSQTPMQWQIGAVKPGQSLPVSVLEGTVSAAVAGRFTSIIVGSGADMSGAAIGHVALMDSDVHGPFWDTVGSSLVAWSGEQAHARFKRLCDEEGIPCVVQGSVSEPMGAQTSDTLLDLWQQCEDSDLGLLNEIGCDGFLFRAHRELVNLTPKVTLDYNSGHLSDPFDPTDDDQALRNDVTVTRIGGSSSRAVQEAGPLAVDAIGRYDDTPNLSLHEDSQTLQQAWWRLHLGTVEEARYPSVTVDLLRNPSLRADVLSLEPGDKIRIINLPKWLPPDAVDLLILGRSPETLGSDGRHLVTFNCVPASPWTVGVVGDRAGASGSELASAVTSAGTTLSVATTTGPRWIDTATYPSMFPFDIRIDGERVTVTDIAGTSSPQTFTVTRSVNGVVKSHDAGADVRLAQPAIAGW